MSATAVRTRRTFGLLVALVGAAGMSILPNSATGAAPVQSSLSMYLDAPFVQGSYVTSGTLVEDFDSLSTGNCPSSIAIGIVSGTRCTVENSGDYGGAGVDAMTSSQSIGGSTVGRYVSTDSSGMTITFPADQSYLGFWWSAGTNGNTVKFFKDNTLLLTVATDDIMTLLGSQPVDGDDWIARNDDTSSNVITSINGSTKNRKMWYFGNPRGYSSTTPSTMGSIHPWEPYMYIHMFAGGNLTFNKVELSGSGFEFDNFVVSTETQTPDPRLVFATEVTSSQNAIRFDGNGTGVQGTMSNQVSATPTSLTVNQYTRSGFTFGGWNTLADGTGTRFEDGATFDFSASITLYAQWTAIPSPNSNDTPAPVASAPTSTESTPTPVVSATLPAAGFSAEVLMSLSTVLLVAGLFMLRTNVQSRRTMLGD